MEQPGSWKLFSTSALILFVTTIALYWPACKNEFVEWDDNAYVYEEPQVVNGVRLESFLWALTADVVDNWHPLTLISLQLDAQLFGKEPFGFHRTAVVIHAINSVLAFWALLSLTGKPTRSFIVALIFALHPLRVESVAWISERKDVLCGLFFFLTLIAYVRYCRLPAWERYALMMIFFALGLSSKSMLVTTPCVLLLLDYWPLERFQTIPTDGRSSVWRLILEKVPLFVLSVIVSIITMNYQKSALRNVERLPLVFRCENAIRGCSAYLSQTLFPLGLSPLYAIPDSSIMRFTAAFFLLGGITVFALWQRCRMPAIVVGWFWFLGMLVPVSGLIQVGVQQRADRYTYLPHIGLLIVIVWSVTDLVNASRRAVMICLFAAVLAITWFGFETSRQIQVWHDTEALWRRAYSVEPGNRPAICHLLPCVFQAGNRTEALRLADEAIRIQDRHQREGLVILSDILANEGEFIASIRAIDQALKSHTDSQLYVRRGEARAAQGSWEEAVNDYRQAVQLSPSTIPFQFCLAHALEKAGQNTEADRIRANALRKSAHWPESAARMAWQMSTDARATRQMRFRAVCLAEEACTVSGATQSQYFDILGTAYASEERFDEAVSATRHAIQLANAEGDSRNAVEMGSRLKLFLDRKPFRR